MIIKLKNIFINLLISIVVTTFGPANQALSATSVSTGFICFWTDHYYEGEKHCYSDAVTLLDSKLNDRFSSVKVFDDYYVEVFKHGNYKGNTSVIMIDTPVFDYLNDDISSFRIHRRNTDNYVCLHENKYYSGTPFCLEDGQSRGDLTNYNDKASGLSIYGETEVLVWKDKSFESISESLLFNEPKLDNTDLNGGEDWQDEISSFGVESVSNLQQVIEDRQWCTTDSHCNIGGKCISGKCQCAGGMSGLNCDQLDLKPAENTTLYEDTTNSYWGGSPILGDDGRFHIFASRFTNSCGLNTWLSNSECVRAASSSPTGPFVTEQVVQGVFCHNPTVRKAPDGSFLLFYIGDDQDNERTQCADGQSFEDGPSGLIVDNCEIRVKRAASITGPWSSDHKVSSMLDNGICPTNPAPIVEEDGSIKLYYRDYGVLNGLAPSWYDFSERTVVPERMYLLKSSKWNGRYTRQQPNAVLAEYGEDGFVWKGSGGYHMVFNNKFSHAFYKGGYASSEDGAHWAVRSSVYTRQVPYADGSVKDQRRERPQILWLNQGEGKGLLMNGVGIGPGDKTATLGFKIGEWDEYFALKDERSNRCIDIPGDDNQLEPGQKVQLWSCSSSANDQQWFYIHQDGSLRNKADPSLCLENPLPSKQGGTLKLETCNNSEGQQFSFDDRVILQRLNSSLAVDATGSDNGALIKGWSVHGGANQRWQRVY